MGGLCWLGGGGGGGCLGSEVRGSYSGGEPKTGSISLGCLLS